MTKLILLAATLTPLSPAGDSPAGTLSFEARIDQAVAQVIHAPAPSRSAAADLSLTIEVVAWRNTELVEPEIPAEPETWLGVPMELFEPFKDFLGVPSGGSTGSPSFDPELRKYWWE